MVKGRPGSESTKDRRKRGRGPTDTQLLLAPVRLTILPLTRALVTYCRLARPTDGSPHGPWSGLRVISSRIKKREGLSGSGSQCRTKTPDSRGSLIGRSGRVAPRRGEKRESLAGDASRRAESFGPSCEPLHLQRPEPGKRGGGSWPAGPAPFGTTCRVAAPPAGRDLCALRYR
jgi:hypothetical protein